MKRIMAALLLLGSAFSASAALESWPQSIKDWGTWLRDKHPDIDCPRIANPDDSRRCIWPGALTLRIDERGAEFEQRWQLHAAAWVFLPGGAGHWPLQVTAGGKAVAVLDRGGVPAVWLEPGEHVLRGRFLWTAVPQFLPVPASTALFELQRDGQSSAPLPDADGNIWLRSDAAAAAAASDAVKVDVFRRIDDGLPRELTTVVRLSVSGRARELLLGKLLLKDLEPMHFDSPLPARIEDDGRLRVQARAGEWTLRLRARFTGDVNRMRMERSDEQWPAQEIWSFAADPSLRRATVRGVATVDPSQLDLPDDFAGLPTYLVEPDSELVLEQQYRGDAAPAANELSIDKTLWLDFDGGGATLRDAIRGRMAQGWRLQALPGIELGRVTVNGEPRLITRLGSEAAGGVEIRDADVDVEALSRVASTSTLPAGGWRSEFGNARLTLQLPPGWKLWHASGPDAVYGSWLAQWNLWNIFLGLLLVAATFRLFDWRIAALALVTVALTYHEADSPVLYFIPMLIAIALLRVLTLPKLRGFVTRAGYAFALLLTLVLLVFAVAQIRTAIYPQLEDGRHEIDASAISAAAAPAPAAQLEKVIVTARKREESLDAAALYMPKSKPRYSAENNVQTGPGAPAWSWRQATLQWTGPVGVDDSLHLYLSGPWLTRIIKLANALLAATLALVLLRAFWKARAQIAGTQRSVAAALLALLAIGAPLHSERVQAQEFPPQFLLDEFEQRLLKKPECAPDCAVLEAAQVRIADGQLTLSLRASAGARIGFPLPAVTNWQPRSVLVDGAPRNFAARAGDALLLPLERGAHQIVLEGPLRGDDISVQFPLAPRDVEVRAEQWDAFGLNGRQLGANSLQLQKRERSARDDALTQAPAKPFARVTRSFDMDLDWVVTTTVERLAPLQGAINLDIPVLPGEAVITPGIDVRDGKIAVSLGSQQNAAQWRSVLKPAPQLQLRAPETAQWVEAWEVLASPRWHVGGNGLNPVKRADAAAAVWRWQPWPGETLTLTAVQPDAIAGAMTTVENAALVLTPARNGSDFVLRFQVNSSVGGDYHVQLHEPAELRHVRVNGADISQSRSDEKILLPLRPGSNAVEIRWRLARGVGAVTRTPAVSLATPAANIDLQLTLPQNRWPLFVHGPKLGPAMLFWGVLIVIALIAYGLGRLVERAGLSIPLRAPQWLLLALGMSTISAAGSIPVVLWFFAVEARAQLPMPQRRFRYNVIQIGLLLLTLIAAVALFSIIPRSLLSVPDMQVAGNGSHDYFYQWYQDRSGSALPQAFVLSAPLWVYRLAMLLWSLWLVFALLRWIKWGWQAFSAGGLWMSKPELPATRTPEK